MEMAFILSNPLGDHLQSSGFSPCRMLISLMQCDVFSIHPVRSPRLPSSPAAAQTCGLCLQSGQTESVEPATVPVPRLFRWRDLLVPPCLHTWWKEEGVWGGRQGTQGCGSILLSRTVAVSPGLATVYFSLCAVNQELTYF